MFEAIFPIIGSLIAILLYKKGIKRRDNVMVIKAILISIISGGLAIWLLTH